MEEVPSTSTQPGISNPVENQQTLDAQQQQQPSFETQQYPSAKTSGFTNPILRCSMPDCGYYCRTHVMYDTHVTDIHLCEDCGCYCSIKPNHECPSPGERLGHVDALLPLDLSNFGEYSRSHLGVIVHYKYKHQLETNDVETAFKLTYPALEKLLEQLNAIHGNMRVEISVSVVMEKDIILDDGVVSTKQATIYFKSANHDLFHATGIDDFVWECAAEIVKKKDTFVENGSQWRVVQVLSFELKMGQLRLFQNARVRGYLPLPFKTKRFGFINFKNSDGDCFKYCVTAALHMEDKRRQNAYDKKPDRNLTNPNTWKHYMSHINFDSLPNGFVNPYQDIPQFERTNDVAVNVYTHHGENVILMRPSKYNSNKIVNLFLIHVQIPSSSSQENNDLYHYVLITDLERFLKEDGLTRMFYCPKCHRKFKTRGKQEEHGIKCTYGKQEGINHSVQGKEFKFPPEDKNVKFRRLEMTHQYPFFICFDFETFSKPVEEVQSTSATVKRYEYVPASYSLVVAHNTGTGVDLLAVEYYDEENPVSHFFQRVFYWSQSLLQHIRATNNSVVPSDDELQQHNDATHCKHCKREFSVDGRNDQANLRYDIFNTDGNLIDSSSAEDSEIETEPLIKKIKTSDTGGRVIKCFNHNHDTGRYESSICQECNLKIRYKYEIPCIAFNGSKFDTHLLLKYMDSSLFDFEDVDVVAKSGEQFVQVNIGARDIYIPSLHTNYGGAKSNVGEKGDCGNRKAKIKIMDASQFIPGSLSTLISRLKKEKCPHFSLLKQTYENYLLPTGTVEEPLGVDVECAMDMLLSKIPYPYAFLSSPERLNPGEPIPSRENFNNSLRHESCTDEEWDIINNVRTAFKIKDFKSYTRLYCVLDSVHLAIIWINFVLNSMKTYKLDPTYCATLPAYSFQAWLYSSGEEVDLIRDKHMYDMVKEGVRGGQSFATRKITTANSARNPEGVDKTKPESAIIYWDLVSLYSHAMQKYKLPVGDFEWENVDELNKMNWQDPDLLSQDNSKGYMLKVDLEYPKHIQDSSSSLPFCPEKRAVKEEWLSDRQRTTLHNLGRTSSRSFLSQPRLLLHCYPRKEYVIHYRALALYLSKGMILKKIHCGFSFTEKAYLRSFIQRNIELRKVAKTESERTHLKLTMNSLYGKMLQNGENFLRIKFCKSGAQARELLASPECVDFEILNECVTIFKFKPKTVVLDKPLITGVSILELAKCIFYAGFYDQLQKIFSDRITVIYSDTDSVCCSVEGNEENIWSELVENQSYFDFSKIPKNHQIFKNHADQPDLCMNNMNESGKWKIESLDIYQLVSLKSKCYSMLFYDQLFDMKNKGVPHHTLNHFCNHETYVSVVEKTGVIKLDVNTIRSINHSLYNMTVSKVAYHGLDIYRCYSDPEDVNFSLPFGHYKLLNE